MTDQDMDARLRAAGERFRAATGATGTTVDVSEATAKRDRRRPAVLIAVAAAAVVLLVAGLALGLRNSTRPAPPSGDLAGLVGNVWLLTAGGAPSTTSLYISRSGVLIADDECQLISGTVHVAGSRLTITGTTVRLKPCLDRSFAPSFNGVGAKVLRGTATFRIDAQAMTITRPGVGSLRFVLAQTPIPPPTMDIPTLTGADWVAPNGSVLHIDPATGQLSGGFCDGRAKVSPPAVRFVGCPLLGRVDRAVLSGTSLTLEAPHGPRWAPMPSSFSFRWRPDAATDIDPAALTGRTWHLESVVGSPAPSGSLRISDGIATVDNGCTTQRHPALVARGTFTLRNGLPTRACSNPAAAADSFLFNDPATWVVRDGKLIVYGGGSQEFAAVYGSTAPVAPQQNPAALLTQRWQAGRGVTLTFPNRNTLLLDTYCTTSRASIDVTATSIVVHDLHVIASLACPSDPSAVHRGMLLESVLRGTAHWSIGGSTLTLTGSSATVVLRPVDPGPAALLGRWTLTSYVPGPPGTAARAVPTPRVAFTFGPRAISAEGTKATATIYTDGRIEFRQPWTDNLSFPHGPALGLHGERFVFASLLQGIVTYHLTGNSLIIVNPKVGQLNLTRRR